MGTTSNSKITNVNHGGDNADSEDHGVDDSRSCDDKMMVMPHKIMMVTRR